MSLIYGFLAIFVAVFFHWASQFLLKSIGTLSRFLIVFSIVIGFLIFLQIVLKTPFEEALSATIWFAFLCELYVFLFTLSLSSISIKILQLLRQRPMTYAEIQTAYRPDSMVSKRFNRLISAGLIQGDQKDLTLTSKGRKLVFLFNFLKNILHYNRKNI